MTETYSNRPIALQRHVLYLLVFLAAFLWATNIFYLAVFPTCLELFAWNEGVRRLGPTSPMAFYNLLPVFGLPLSVITLGEKVTWIHLVGGLLVLGGGLWVILGGNRRVK